MKFIFFITLSIFLFAPSIFAQVCQDGARQPCGVSNTGECRFGTQICSYGDWGICLGSKDPLPELCGDSKDNDCDGATDEQCDCLEGETRQCGVTDVGICAYGSESCVNGTWSGQCLNETKPKLNEICFNQLDDTCNGSVDEGCSSAQTNVTLNQTSSCFNGVQDSGETDIDCGGLCRTCTSCTDGVLNQGEIKTTVDFGHGNLSDCGGPNCPACPTCFDNQQNQGETDIDCGGPCRSCASKASKKTTDDEDNDGLSAAIELRRGTDPLTSDTDVDGILDKEDAFPLCPNLVCDDIYGETPETCPEDCGTSSSSFLWIFLFFMLLFVFGGYLFFVLRKNKRSSAKKPLQPQQLQKTSFSYTPLTTTEQSQRKSAVEKELEKSLEKADSFFKK